MVCERTGLIPFEDVATPAYLILEEKLEENCRILLDVKEKAGCRIILALKAFSMYATFPLIARYLDGITASSLNETRLGFEEFGKDVHVYIPAYTAESFEQIVQYANYISFNSFSNFEKLADLRRKYAHISYGMRINPCCPVADNLLYDPSAPYSRLGVTADIFAGADRSGLEGLHVHNLCEQNVDALVKTLTAVEEQFGTYLYGMKWLNLGGGHHITRADYDRQTLIELVRHLKKKYDLEIILEPGEAIALNAGYLVSSVLDIVHNQMDIAILDASAATHMPDVIEGPYRPRVSSEVPGAGYTYRLAGNSCLAGDVIGDYSFAEPLKPGSKLVFEDMAIYTMVKNNTFNGINLPDIVLRQKDGTNRLIKSFGYQDFKSRL